MGTVLFRLTLIACGVLAATASPAFANATVDFIGPGAGGISAPAISVLGDGNPDAITVAPAGVRIRFTGANLSTTSPECDVNGGATEVICDAAPSISIDLRAGNDSLTATAMTIPLAIAGGIGNDKLTGGAGNDVLSGGPGGDELDGAAGIDEYFGEGGDDTISAHDGIAERISCGDGNDAADNDPIDVIAECERGFDTDGDGFSSAIDCDDRNRAINPGAVDIPENGIDEDCTGADARNLDRDRDGFAFPSDCDDGNAAIHPGALEIRGNAVDENCDSVAPGFALLRSLVSTNWQFGRTFTRLRALVVRNAPAGARISVKCSGGGCPFKGTKRTTVPRDLAPISLKRFFGNAKLRRNARVTIAVTAAGVIGRTYTYRIKLGELPAQSIVCRAPGEAKGRSC